MALPFTITAIEAPPLGQAGRQPISTGFDLTKTIYDGTTIWPSPDPYTDPNLSPRPVAFQFVHPFVRFILHGTFPLPGQYVVTGALGTVQIESLPIQVGVGGSVLANSFTFIGPSVPNTIAPFKCAGDWTWTITPFPNNGAPAPVVSEQPTRIEAYFFKGEIAPPFTVDGFHVAELLRLIVQDLVLANSIVGDPIVSYARHIAWTMWMFGGPLTNVPPLQYDCRRGSGGFAGYRCGLQGGEFDLGLFLRRIPPREIYPGGYPLRPRQCNCYDLAGIIQVCCQALGMAAPDAVNPFIHTKWCFMQPFGFVSPGPLFGWRERDHIDVNNPFWKGDPQLLPPYNLDSQRNFTQLNHRDRRPFSNHAWIKFRTQAAQWRVLDITHGCQTAPPGYSILAGQYDEDNYLIITRDPNPPNNNVQIGGGVGRINV